MPGLHGTSREQRGLVIADHGIMVLIERLYSVAVVDPAAEGLTANDR